MTGFEDRGDVLREDAPGVEAVPFAGPAAGSAAPPWPTPEEPDLRRACGLLADRIVAALDGPAENRPLRLAVAVPGLDPLGWLAAQAQGPKLFWRDRDGSERVAGVGVADRLALGAPEAMGALLEQARRRLRDAPPDARYYGGFRFDLTAPQGTEWRPFGLGWLLMPRFEAVERGGRSWLCCTVMPGRDRADTVLAALAALAVVPRAPKPLPSTARCGDSPDPAGWARGVRDVTAGIRSGEGWRKVVLARRTELRAGSAVDPLGMMEALAARAPGCFQFCFSPDGRAAFLGASPEQLFHRRGETLASEALAGTRPRGGDPVSDAGFEADLRASAKDGREHGFVDGHVRAAMARLTEGIQMEATPSVLKLASVQHLVRRVRGRLRAGVGDAAIMAALNPTPAVCGEPCAAAIARIRAIEPFDRGWYAGPVGFVGRDESRFAVAIRSALVQDGTVALYAGAGIVEGSCPEAEWRELEAKLGGIWPGPTV